MSTVRILHISDTHLSPRKDHFRRNNELMAQALRRSDHDVVVHTGDITMDGVRYEEDYVLCRAFFAQFPKTPHFLPGNHDVGDNPALSKSEAVNGSAISAARLQRYRAYFGDDRWSLDIGSWRLIGLDSMLIGSGLPDEAEQFDWMDATLDGAGQRHIAIFTHQPLFIDEPEPTERTYWTVDPSGSARLRRLIQDPRLRLIASGHIHQQRSRRRDNVSLQWAPSIAFATGESLVPEMGGQRAVGYLEHTLLDDGAVDTRSLRVEGMADTFLDDIVNEIYPTF